MLGPYRQVLRRPGAAAFSSAAALARLQMSMMSVGAVLLLSAVRDSYTLAGVVSAIYTVATALIGPQVSRLIDARGQRSVVPVQLAVHVAAVAALIAVVVATPAVWPIFPLAAVAGASQPSIGSLVRARWSTLMSGSPHLRTAYAWESLIDEAIYIVGPPLATVLALHLFPSAALVCASAVMLVGTWWLLTQRSTEPPAAGGRVRSTGPSAIVLPGVGGIFAVMILLGGVFGSLEVATLATAKAAGHAGAAGWLLALYAVGSLTSGTVFGALSLSASLLRQFVGAVGALAVVSAPLVFLGPLWLLAIGLTIAGCAAAPALIAGTSLMERIVPAGRLTESMAWVSSGINLGVAIAMPLTGYLVDRVPAHRGYLVLWACAILAMLVALAVLRALRRAQAASPRESIVPGAPSVDAPLLDTPGDGAGVAGPLR